MGEFSVKSAYKVDMKFTKLDQGDSASAVLKI